MTGKQFVQRFVLTVLALTAVALWIWVVAYVATLH